eukprot:snap_masked-scaffold_28-processed-gene-2.11-mRNA-1 protein AED:1.00 eAED:1.00 QI:0/0/0/0/1/1/4/0/67
MKQLFRKDIILFSVSSFNLIFFSLTLFPKFFQLSILQIRERCNSQICFLAVSFQNWVVVIGLRTIIH